MDETKKKYIKKLKTLNIVMLVFMSISTLVSLAGLPLVLKPKKAAFELYGSYANELYQRAVNDWPGKIFTIFSIVLLVLLIWWFIRSIKQLNQGQLAPKYPYYIYLGRVVLNLLYSFLFTKELPPMEGVAGVQEAIAMTQIIGLIVSIVTMLTIVVPAILAIIYSFKADPEEISSADH